MSEVKMQKKIYESYEREILYLRRHGNKLLQKIKQKEIKMNRRKQQNLQPNQKDLNTLNQMIKKLLRMLAFIDSYQYFQIIKEPLTYNNNETFFYEVANDYYEDALQRFVLKVNVRVKQLQLDRSVDFSIS